MKCDKWGKNTACRLISTIGRNNLGPNIENKRQKTLSQPKAWIPLFIGARSPSSFPSLLLQPGHLSHPARVGRVHEPRAPLRRRALSAGEGQAGRQVAPGAGGERGEKFLHGVDEEEEATREICLLICWTWRNKCKYYSWSGGDFHKIWQMDYSGIPQHYNVCGQQRFNVPKLWKYFSLVVNW